MKWKNNIFSPQKETYLTIAGRSKQPDQDTNLKPVIEWKPKSNKNVSEGFYGVEKGQNNPVHHPPYISTQNKGILL